MLRAAIYSHIARRHIPTAKVNLVRVVINGEYWGVYANSQQFNKDFLKEHKQQFGGTSKGTRWKVPGSPRGRGSLEYLGDDPARYKTIYAIKTDDAQEAERAWKALINLCRTLHETPPEKLQEKLSPILDIDGALWFLAIENALINSDGYWIRSSDYHLFLNEKGRFHLVPHDINEALAPGGGPGRFRGPRPGGPPPGPQPGGPQRPPEPRQAGPRGGGGVDLDPLTGADDPAKPLLHKLLAVPSLREQYLKNIRTIAAEDLDWEKLGPVVRQYAELIDKDVQADTRKLDTYDAFKHGVADDPAAAGPPQGRVRMSLKQFVDQRRQFLLEHPQIKALPGGE
jgi:hypothetical protein